MLYQSKPGVTMGEADGIAANLGNTATMASYYADLQLFFQRAGAAGGPPCSTSSPTCGRYIQQRATNDNAATVPVQVGGTGVAELAGLPDTAAGFAQAIVRLRDRYAPNVRLGYHFSSWGTGNDFIYSDPSRQRRRGPWRQQCSLLPVAGRPIRRGLHRSHRPRRRVQAAQLRRRRRIVVQRRRLPPQHGVHRRLRPHVGPAGGHLADPVREHRMQAMNNTWNHYQDNKVEWLLDEPARAHLDAYAKAGVIALLFGRGADGATCPCDANGDGVTNPAPINGNTRVSRSAPTTTVGSSRTGPTCTSAAGPCPCREPGGQCPPIRRLVIVKDHD